MNIDSSLQLKLIEQVAWADVFSSWYEREGNRKEWQKVAREKGWKSWKEWRSNWISPLDPHDRRWFRYAILDPLKTIPRFRIGPTKSWQKNFSENERNRHTFAELIESVPYRRNKKIMEILDEFPEATEFIGILLSSGIIVLLEGHHRATAAALAAKEGRILKLKHLPTVVLSSLKTEDEHVIDDMLKKGSIKPNKRG